MADFLAGDVSYPGLISFNAFTYTCSHGISPGTITINANPGSSPLPFGDMIFTDGRYTFPLSECKLEKMTTNKNENGEEDQFVFSDRRWKWRDGGTISGCYNQLDPNGKLIPRMVRSPLELAILLLNAMGVSRVAIDLPPGVTSQMAAGLPQVLPTGFNFPILGVNPPVNWDAVNPAQALDQLCNELGSRIVYDPFADAVYITRNGQGQSLPIDSIKSVSQTLQLPQAPDVINIVGDRIKFELLLELEPYGEEWNGMYLPINQLSYTPVVTKTANHTVNVTCKLLAAGSQPPYYRMTINPPNANGFDANGQLILPQDNVYYPTGSDTVATILGVFQTWLQGLNGNKDFVNKLAVTLAGGTLTVTAKLPGWVFVIQGYHNLTVKVAVAGIDKVKTWENEWPPEFAGVQATTRLTREQAINLAKRSVWRCYALTGVDVSGAGPIQVPTPNGAYSVRVRQNITLTDTKVSQVVPDPGLAAFLTGPFSEPYMRDYYNGYSKSQSAACFGSVSLASIMSLNHLTYAGPTVDKQNTPTQSIVPLDFSVVEQWQMIVFGTYVFKQDVGGKLRNPRLLLNTGVYVRDNDTNQFFRFNNSLVIRQGSNVASVIREDVQLGIIGGYQRVGPQNGGFWRLQFGNLLEADPLLRSNYYLQGELLKYLVKGGIGIQYNGLAPIRMSGRVHQATWKIQGGVGMETEGSEMFEHDTWTPPYPARRRIENLRAVERVRTSFTAKVNPASEKP